MNFRRKSPDLPSFNFTSMIDVVFLLLCFFITSSVFSQWETEVDIVLPTAETAKMPERLPGEVIVNLTKEGVISINQQAFTLEQLRERLRRLVRAFPGQPVVIRADKECSYESVVAIIDSCRLADIWNISFATAGEQ